MFEACWSPIQAECYYFNMNNTSLRYKTPPHPPFSFLPH